MPHTEIEIETRDGRCPARVFRPEGEGPWPGVIFYMDGIGIRPALFDMAERLASAGYYVLLPNLYYRVGSPSYDAKTLFSDPVTREDFNTRTRPSASIDNIMRDSETFLSYLEARPQVRKAKVGVTGYCMGGRLAFAASGHFPDRIAAAAAYHPSGLATDAPDSPHKLAPRITARVYVGRAKEDAGFDEAQMLRLERTLTESGVRHTIETYDARHGWVPADTPMHDPLEAERHWETLLELFGGTLGGSLRGS
ncbi:MAG TPA: dienelactone hydrolase family protein [Gemmatimonadaceae bacterium]|nr:dienelactone hydrolase family protein [Gemmatimonadaceae bacterium]